MLECKTVVAIKKKKKKLLLHFVRCSDSFLYNMCYKTAQLYPFNRWKNLTGFLAVR